MNRAAWLPTVSRYLLREFGRAFALCLAAFVGLYLCVDFFERFPGFLSHDAPTHLVALYFALKIPLILTQMAPVAVLAAMLLSLGNLARRSELMAMRSCGISLWQIGAPLVGACLAISLLTLAWSEYVVPGASMQAHYVDRVQIKNKKFRGHFNEAEIWYHGPGSFTNIDRFDANRNEIYGLTRYEFDDSFRLRRIVEVRVARWTGSEWRASDVDEIRFDADGAVETARIPDSELKLDERPDDFTAVHREPEDLSYRSLAREIRDLRRKGIDTTEAKVDLWLKLAVPFISVVMALIAIPLASRHGRGSGMAASVGAALVVGFTFWVVLALTTSLGKGGVLPAPLAAWSANVIFGAIGLIFFLGSE
jgi:lipopolysaccharide export system permease protein